MANKIELDSEDLKTSLLGLAVALIEIIKDTLKLQAVRRMEKGSLTEEEVERMGTAIMKLETVIEEIKNEHGVRDAVNEFQSSLDDVAEDVLGLGKIIKEAETV